MKICLVLVCVVVVALVCSPLITAVTGHSGGFASVVVPGAGEPNFDSFAANPYESAKQRREAEVAMLLDKLPATTIGTLLSLLPPLSLSPIWAFECDLMHESQRWIPL
jgi:hypothetical protein